ncbi:TetR/AcrR family transcriptional regulator [Pollutimonas sp. H1-120]|uniref:TetR/AcrR family transcriptional regulator n=1 Tax=Pollutimonas sp. H1-120 TaxID=3148824 RepID=UPI003B51D96A
MSKAKQKMLGIKEKRELQRRTVVEAAAKLFSQKGYAGTSMLDVARALEISRPALYHYFVSKEDVLTTLVKEVTLYLENVGDSLTADGSRDPAETLYEMTRKNVLFILNNTVMFRVVERSENDLPEDIRRLNDRAKRGIYDRFRIAIERGIETGHFRKVDPAVAAFSIIGLCSWSAWWYSPDGRLIPEEIADQVAMMGLESVRASDGKSINLDELRPAIADARKSLERLSNLFGKN